MRRQRVEGKLQKDVKRGKERGEKRGENWIKMSRQGSEVGMIRSGRWE